MKLILIVILVLISFSAYAVKNNRQAEPPIVDLAALLSNGNSNVVNKAILFVADREEYFNTHKQELLNNRGIESSEQVTSEIVLVDALLQENLLVYADWKQDPSDVLEQLLELSDQKLKRSNNFEALSKHYSDTEYGIGEFFDEKGDWPSIFECVRSVGLNLMAINENSDAYALFLIEERNKQKILDILKNANISLYRFRADEM